ncbi:MAG: hypothetical protein RR555_11015 [Bacteroidales bacterium]
MEPIFIQNNPEQIISETIIKYQQLSGQELNPADAERILIDCLAYRESVLRGQMEVLMRNNFIQYASDSALDRWGELFNVIRLSNEADDDYRRRILASSQTNLQCTELSYKTRILALPEVSDLVIIRRKAEPTLPPGISVLIPIMRVIKEGVVAGDVHNNDLEVLVLDNIYNENFGVIGALFEFRKAIPVPLSGTIRIKIILSGDQPAIAEAVEAKVNEYFSALSLKFVGEFAPNDLSRLLLTVPGVRDNIISFTNIPVKAATEFFTKGNITITYE